MDATEYLKLVAKADLEHRVAIEALNQVWRMSNGDKPPPQPIRNHDEAVNSVRGLWRQVAKGAIDRMRIGEEFTVQTLRAAMATTHPTLETDVIGVNIYLKKLLDDKEIKLVRAGSGRRGAVYAKK